MAELVGRSLVRIAVSNFAKYMDMISILYVANWGFCNGPITRQNSPTESGMLMRVIKWKN